MTTSARFGRIICDDEIEDEIVGKLQDWVLAYQAEVERQRGWEPRSLEAPRSIIPVALFERQAEDGLPCITVHAEQGQSKSVAQGQVLTEWTVEIELVASGVDVDDTRRVVRAHAAAVRALMMQQGGTGPLVTDLHYRRTEYTPTAERMGRTLGVAAMQFVGSVLSSGSTRRGGMTTPPEDPYAAPAGLVQVEETNVTVGDL